MNKIVSEHRMTVNAVVCEDGTARLCGVVEAKLPPGVEIIGNGTLPHPLSVKLTGYMDSASIAAVIRNLSGTGSDERREGIALVVDAINELLADTHPDQHHDRENFLRACGV